MEMMSIPSVSPLEGGRPEQTRKAQEVFLAGAARLGFATRIYGSPPLTMLHGSDIPAPVRTALSRHPAHFLAAQPTVVVAMGTPQPARRRLVLNFHIDTVGPHIPPRLEGDTLHGRGSVDNKGPGVALAAGVAAAFAAAPWLTSEIEVLIASVPGEEGGAMGVYGTRWLVASGLVGRLMLFAEPTGSTVLDSCTSAMTPLLSVEGQDSTDDQPDGGHNASVALGFLADFLARHLGPRAAELGAKLCIAGIHTGEAHNRVYGSGALRVNIAYQKQQDARRLEEYLTQMLSLARDEFTEAHSGNPLTDRLIADWDRIVRLDWLKRDLPVLSNRDSEMEALLARAGFARHNEPGDGAAFTCDAIWAGGPGRYVAVCGPGHLDLNGAHTPGERVAVQDLSDYAGRVASLVEHFGNHIASQEKRGRR